jgi:hypothetical protein
MLSTIPRILCGLLIALTLTSVGLTTVSAAEIQDNPTRHYTQERAAPVIILIERDPWQLVIGADSPSFALYDSGLLIYRTPDEFKSLVLNPDEYTALLADLTLDDAFFELDDYYDVSQVTDQPMNTIHAWRNGQRQTVSVYGDLRRGNFTDLAAVPTAFYNLFIQMTSYSHPAAEDWFPQRIEVMLWPADRTDGADWPADFPSLNSEFAARRSDDQFSIFIDASLRDRLADIYDNSTTILINQQAWWFSWRPPFPHEFLWANPTLDQFPIFADEQADLAAFGSDVFDDEKWSLTLSQDYMENNFRRLTAIWQRDDDLATANFSRQLMRSPFPDADSLAAALSDRWMAIEWLDYDDVEMTQTCVLAETIIIDLSFLDNDTPAIARYWVWQNDSMLNEFKLVVPATNAAELDMIAARLFPDTSRCPAD